jgi:hypothetical protein
MGVENRDLGSGRIVFRQPGNFFEQFAAARIIKESARQAFARLRQALDHARRELVVRAGNVIGLAQRFVTRPHHSLSEARRSPMNCQRWGG